MKTIDPALLWQVAGGSHTSSSAQLQTSLASIQSSISSLSQNNNNNQNSFLLPMVLALATQRQRQPTFVQAGGTTYWSA
jgi:hypothetical protein